MEMRYGFDKRAHNDIIILKYHRIAVGQFFFCSLQAARPTVAEYHYLTTTFTEYNIIL